VCTGTLVHYEQTDRERDELTPKPMRSNRVTQFNNRGSNTWWMTWRAYTTMLATPPMRSAKLPHVTGALYPSSTRVITPDSTSALFFIFTSISTVARPVSQGRQRRCRIQGFRVLGEGLGCRFWVLGFTARPQLDFANFDVSKCRSDFRYFPDRDQNRRHSWSKRLVRKPLHTIQHAYDARNGGRRSGLRATTH